MAKMIEYDNTGIESGGGTGVKVKPGVHPARIIRVTQRETKTDGSPANDLEVVLDFGEEFDWGFTYIGLGDAAQWKLTEFTRALGMKEKGKFDPEKLAGKILRVKVNPGTWDGGYSPDIGRLMKAQPGDEDKIGQGSVDGDSPSASADDDGPDPEPEPDAEFTGDGFWREGYPDPSDPNETVGSYDDWDDPDLEAEVNDRELTLPGGRSSKHNKMIEALRANDSEVVEAQGGSGDGSADDDYDSWDLDQLKAEWEQRTMGDLPKFRGRGAESRVMEAIVEALRNDDNENPFS